MAVEDMAVTRLVAKTDLLSRLLRQKGVVSLVELSWRRLVARTTNGLSYNYTHRELR